MPFSTCCRQLAGAFFCRLFFIAISFSASAQTAPTPTDPRDTLRILAEDEQRRTMDPALGRVPYERLEEARQQLLTRKSIPSAQTQGAIPNVTWQERGPSNAGGRTRALLFDPNDATYKKVWAGGPAGGLWFTNDITDANAGWTPVSDAWESLIVTALAADPSNPQIMYAGTGDMYDYRPGGGIWKTTDGGANWIRLSSTIPGGNSPTISRAFDYIQRIVVNSSGQVFVATQYGVVRSTDGGANWGYALAPNQAIGVGGTPTNNYYYDQVTDLDLGTDGILYAAFNPSRVFKSDSATGSNWTEITPPGASGGQRTELALAPSTSGSGQVLYGVARMNNSANYAKDLKWFKKSTNGGVTWTDMTIPADNNGNYFTNGNGYYSMNLTVKPSDPNTVYAGGYDWYRSVDGGYIWANSYTSSSDIQQGIWFQPSGLGTALASESGIRWSLDWQDNTTAKSTVALRNNGYRVREINSVAIKSTPGSNYILGTSRGGAFKLTTNGLSAGSVFYSYAYDMGITFIDEDAPSVQLFASGGSSYYLYDGAASVQYLFSVGSSGYAADYDSQSNTLYTSDYLNGTYMIRKVAGIGSTLTTTQFPLPGLTNSLSCIKLNKDRTALFAGGYPGKLYKVTNLSQSAPTITAIDNGAFPQYTNISGIDVGADDNELLVTLSNYGVPSIWYTNNGGQTWINKDQSNYGLLDMPVRGALFNPQNRKQVLLATELGVWSTFDITASNPGWEPTSGGLGTFRVNQLRYRASDGRMAAATTGRGVFISDALAVPYNALPTVTLTSVSNATLCAGGQFTVSFTKSGPAMGSNNKYEVWISDANGDFTNMRRIGSGADSPVTATLPGGYNALPYGTNYRVKVIATNPEVESGVSDALALGNLNSVYVMTRNNEGSGSVTVFPNRSVTLSGQATDNYGIAVQSEKYQWVSNGSNIPGATAANYTTTNPGTYTLVVSQAGCVRNSPGYTVYNSTSPQFYTSADNGSILICQGQLSKLVSSYSGDNASFQWIRNGNDIAGATGYTYIASETGLYTYKVQDGPYSATASAQYIQVGQSLPIWIRSLSAGDTLRCATYSGETYLYLNTTSPSFSYQWNLNSIPIPGANSSSYSAHGTGAYNVTVKQNACETNSSIITIRPITLALPVSIDYIGSTTLCTGESRTIYASIVGGVTYQWQKNGVDIPGATNYSFTVNSSGDYAVRVIQATCTGISNHVQFQFGNSFVFKIGSIYDSGACGSYYLGSLEQNSQSGYTYQWQKDGTDLNGVTYSFYQISSPGLYSLRVTNSLCAGISKPFYATIGSLPKLNITPILPTQRCKGGSVLLSLSPSIGALQWKRNGIAIPFAQRSSYYATESGLYSLVSTQGPCQTESDPVEVKIGEPTTAQLTGNALVSSGTAAQLPVSFTGPAPWSFTLTNGQSVQNTYQNPYLLPVAPSATTTYALSAVNNACGFGTVTGNAVVTVGTGQADVSLSMALSSRTPKLNDIVDVLMTLTNAGPQEALGVQAQSRLPAGLDFVDSSSPGVSVAGGLVTANAGTLAVNGVNTLSFRARVTQPGTFATAAQITATQTPDPDSQPNSGTGDGQDDTATADLRTADATGPLLTSTNPNQVPLPQLSGNQPPTDPATADLSLTLSTNALNVKAGDVVMATLTVSNRGGSAASSVVVQTVLPNGWSLTNSAGLVVSGQTVKGYINQLAAGKSAVLVLPIQVGNGGLLQAQILDMGESDPDSTPGNGFSKGEDDEATTQIRVR